MTGIEVVKVMYLALKFGGFPIIALLYGYNFKQYEYFFDQHIDTVLMLTVGSVFVLACSLRDFMHTVTLQSSIYAIMYGIIVVAVKSRYRGSIQRNRSVVRAHSFPLFY